MTIDLSLLPDGGVGWLDASGKHSDIVLSTRIRLARNVEGYAFTARARDGERLRVLLGQVEGVTIHDPGSIRCGIVTFAVDGTSAEQIKEALAKERINVTVAGTSTAVIDALERDLPNLVRASVHYFNTDEELERAVECVRLASRC